MARVATQRRALIARESEEECGAFTRLRFYPHAAPVALDDLVTDRQADSAPAIFSTAMQALKETKYLHVVLPVDANPVIRNAKLPHTVLFMRGDLNPRGRFASVLETVPYQIL